MKYETVLCLDPSGAFQEGKGTSGWVLFEKNIPTQFGAIYAAEFDSAFKYWRTHTGLIHDMDRRYGIAVVVEDYLLYANEIQSQINSRMETCQLLGVLKYYCGDHDINIFTQRASEVKQRWSDHVLLAKGILTKPSNRLLLNGLPTQEHIRDALRHGMHFTTFYNK